MKVQITERELREVLRQSHTRSDGKVLISEVELDLLVEECQAHRQRERLSPEEQIRRNPALALDDTGPDTRRFDAMTTLLRWMQYPERARGLCHFVPHGHPCGLGGQTIYIPKDFPLPNAAA